MTQDGKKVAMSIGPEGQPLCQENEDGCLNAIDAWIEGLHPGECLTALQGMREDPDPRQDAALFALLGHCVLAHDLGPLEVAEAMHQHWSRGPAEQRLLDAIAARSAEWTEHVIQQWDDLGEHDSGSRVVNAFVRAMGGEGFQEFLAVLQADGLAEAQPSLFEGVLPYLINGTDHGVDPTQFLQENLPWLFTNWMRSTIWHLTHSSRLAAVRDKLLEDCLGLGGEEAARAIIDLNGWTAGGPSVVLQATQVLERPDPSCNEYAVGLSASLHLDPDYALPRIVGLAHGNESHRMWGGVIGHNLKKWPKQQQLFDALATDACSMEPVVQELFAKIDLDLVSQSETAIAWMEQHPPTAKTSAYHAALLVELLSDETLDLDSDLGRRVIALAEALFGEFGHHEEDDVLVSSRAATMRTNARYPRLRALALVKDVLRGAPEPPAVDEVLARMKMNFPATYKALGSERLDQFLEGGSRFVGWWWYEDGHEEAYTEAHQAWEDSVAAGEPNIGAGFAANHHAAALNQRQVWDARFALIQAKAPDYDIKEKALREDPTYWTEIWLHALLLQEFDQVEREPDDVPGLEDKRPDFRLTAPEGSLLLEVTEVQPGPGSMLTGVRAFSGMELQKQIDDKWAKQFKKCQGDAGMPIVLAVRVSNGFDLEHDLTSSCFGQMAFSWSADPNTGETMAEGSTRKEGRGFYYRHSIECISGVIGFTPDGDTGTSLVGDVLHPIRPPAHPIPHRLWARLRTALFGPRPPKTMAYWKGLPGVTEDEIIQLVDAGYDHPTFMAAGRYTREEGFPINADRWAEIRGIINVRTHLRRHGRLADLPGFSPDVVDALAALGVHTVTRVLHSTPRDGRIRDEWIAAVEEAAVAWGFSPRSDTA